MVDKKQILFDVAKLAEKFDQDLREILANYENNIDAETWNAIYDRCGKVRTAMDEVEAYIAKNVK